MTYALQTAAYRLLHDEFMQYAERIGYHEDTREYMKPCAREFLWWCEAQGIEELHRLKVADIDSYREYLRERPSRLGGCISEQGIYTHLYTVRLLLNHQEQIGRLSKNPMSVFALKSPEAPPRTVLSTEEIGALYAVCDRPRERAILALLYGCGLRRMEAAGLDLRDMRLGDGLLFVRKGKGSKSRTVPMSTGVMRDLREYLSEERPLLLKRNNLTNSVLVTALGGRMKPETVSQRVHRLAGLSGLPAERRISAHVLRHSIATHLLQQGMPIEQVQLFLGHSELDTTQIYTHINQEQLQQLQQLSGGTHERREP